MRTMPKSRIFSGPPSLSTIRLAGLMSRCTMPVLWAWASPEHRPSIISSLRTSGIGSRRRISFESGSPRTNSIAMNGRPSKTPNS